MGHSSIKVTFDLYGHLMPGSVSEAATQLGHFLEGHSGLPGRSVIDPKYDARRDGAIA
jgi:hypothetical protein